MVNATSKPRTELPFFEPRKTVLDSEFIYTELKQMLMIGEFVPGQKLPLPMLADAFGTSQMPIREATNRLISVRALESPPRRSVSVPEASPERMNELLPLRLLLEGEATRLAVSQVTPDLLEELAAITRDMADKVPSESLKDYLRLNQKFHFLIYQSCGNSELLDLIELLWMRYGPMLNIVRSGALSNAGNQHHLDIIGALKRGNGQHASEAMQDDISDAAAAIRDAMR